MWRRRFRLSRSAARDDRGFTFLGILLGALTTMATIAVVGAAIVIRQKANENPGGFAVAVTKSTAVRDAHDLPVVQVSYRVNFKSAAAAQAQLWPVHVQCRMEQQGARARAFQTDDAVLSTTVFYFGEAVIAPGEQNKDIEGPFTVQCWLTYHGATFSHSKGDDVNVPKPGGAEAGGVGDIADLMGAYPVALVRQTGNEVDCVVDGERSFTVTPLSNATIRVELQERQNSFEAKLGSDLRFSGSISLNPGFRDYYGLMEGQFVRGTGPIRMTGTVKTQAPACTFTFDGARKDG